MKENKYCNRKNNHPLNLELDGCPLAGWGGGSYGKALFAKHPNGFNIFIPPDKITACDEYATADPYSVVQHYDSQFHARRRELTIDLLMEVVSLQQGAPQILDLGCGQGHLTEKMRQAFPCAEISGLDYSISAIEYAHGHFPQIDFVVGDAFDTPYAREFFDVVVCNNLWEHVPAPLLLLSEITRILKSGGHLIISTPSRYRYQNVIRILRGKPIAFISPHHVTEYTIGQVMELLSHGGFQVRRMCSKPITPQKMKTQIAQSVMAWALSLIGSHHRLEGTVFYLAQKTPATT